MPPQILAFFKTILYKPGRICDTMVLVGMSVLRSPET